jgi:hypothetical protein
MARVPQGPSTPRKNRAAFGMTEFLTMYKECIYNVYMMQSSSGTLFIGMSSNLHHRVIAKG